jgi:FkbM family methyltransferase
MRALQALRARQLAKRLLRTLEYRSRRLARRVGVSLGRYTPQASAGAAYDLLLNRLGIDLIVDVGANEGQYALDVRLHGYRGRILSFEPLQEPHLRLVAAAKADANWVVAPRMAISDVDGDVAVNVAGNSLSSSILPMLPLHAAAAPGSAYVGQETVRAARLDSVLAELLGNASRIMVKIDTQGFEGKVLAGASATLERVTSIHCELSLVPLYEGQPLWRDLMSRLEQNGFELYAIYPGYIDERTGRMLQVDGVFVKLGD